MKTLLSLVFISLLGASAFADIQDPPANDQGPTRKLSRGLANIAFAGVELLYQPSVINYYEGNSAMMFLWWDARGFGRFSLPHGGGLLGGSLLSVCHQQGHAY